MFEALREELSHWSAMGKITPFWWRDDDAQSASMQLEDLLEISARYQAPLSLAAIPDGLDDSLAKSLIGLEHVQLLQHGFSHRNFAPAEERKMELGWHRSGAAIMQQLHTGFQRLQTLFGEQFIPVMVPPWNRIDQRVIARLRKAGFIGLSTLGPRENSDAYNGLKVVNVHVDIINWKQGRCFAGEAACEAQIVAHLSAKRAGCIDVNEPTGIMSHHRVHDAGCQQFLVNLFEFLGAQEAAILLDAKTVFSRESVS